MKKAKQILSLMLVIAMALGMMVFVPGTASAKNLADYPDADDIEYKEAVDVLSALGVLLGDDSGAFNPKGNITREQAAKIITYILIGTTAADRLAPRASSFTDVETSRWSNPYIEYCVEKGIIKGYTDGRFGPADPVTASQMAKMLLMCIGYGAMGEYDNADSWELNSIVDGQRRGILTLDEDFTQPASREQVALYTFNTLTDKDNAFLVTYSDLAKQYLTAGSSWIINSEISRTLGEETFRLHEASKNDPLGYSVRTWKLNSPNNADSLTGEYRTDVTLFSSSEGPGYLTGTVAPFASPTLSLTSTNSMYFKSQLRTYVDAYDRTVLLEVYVNGVPVTNGVDKDGLGAYIKAGVGIANDGYAEASELASATVFSDDPTITPPATTAALVTIDALCYVKGVTVELVDRNGDGHADKVIIIRKSVATVLANPSKDAFGTTTIPGVTYDAGGGSMSDAYAMGSVVYPEDLKAGDLVLYYRDANPKGGVTHIEKAQSASGTLTAYNKAGNPAMNSVTIAGATYVVSGLYNGKVTSPQEKFSDFVDEIKNFSTDVTVYLDDGKNAIGFVPGEEADLKYLVIVSAPQALGHSAQAEVVMADGTYTVIDVATLVYANGVATSNSVHAKIDPDTIYSYSIDYNGKYTLTQEGSTPKFVGGISQTANFTGLPGDVGNDSTVFVVYDVPSTTYKVYTGIKNVPAVTSLGLMADATNNVVMVTKSGIARFVYVRGNASSVSANMLYFPNVTTYSLGALYADGLRYYHITAINPETGASEVKTLTSAAYKQLLSGTRTASAFVDVGYSSGDVISSISYPSVGRISGSGIVTEAKNGVILLGPAVGGTPYRYNANTKVYSINMMFNTATAVSIDSFAAGSAYYFAKLSNEVSSPDLMTEIYIVPNDQLGWFDMYAPTFSMFVPTVIKATATTGVTPLATLEADIRTNTLSVMYNATFTATSATSLFSDVFTGSDLKILGYYDEGTFSDASVMDGTGSIPTGNRVVMSSDNLTVTAPADTYYALVSSPNGVQQLFVEITVDP